MSSHREQSSILRPVASSRKLTSAVVDRLSKEITSGRLVPGARLPTEQAMMAAMGVSRTVVREAVAALRAEGLVVTKQGVGAFVASDLGRRPFRVDAADFRSIAEVLDIMELRTSVEIEAAALAAERASPAQIDAIGEALAAVDRAIARAEAAIDEDFAFHRAIAMGAHNAQFVRFLEHLGRIVIPRRSIRLSGGRAGQRAYLSTIQGEHCEIFAAIRARDPAAAREAMRRHLNNGRERYRRLAAENGVA